MKAVILAAGKGSRLGSEKDDIPKALRLANGRPLISYVLENIDFIPPEDICIVVGFLGDKVKEALGPDYHYVEQTEQKGTAHATSYAKEVFGGHQGDIMVLYCDMPLLRRETYLRMFDEHEKNGAANTLLAAKIDPPPAFGRIIRDAQGEMIEIIEDSACTPEQKKIDEVNVGIQVLDGPKLWEYLPKITNDNPKGEYYLTGIIEPMVKDGLKQHVVTITDMEETWGVNTLEDLAAVEAALKCREGES